MINIDNKKTAIIIIDLQNDYVDEKGQISKWKLGTKNLQEKLPKIKSFVEVARENSIDIIHIQMTEGKDHIDPTLRQEREKQFGDPENWELAVPGSWGYELILTPKENDKIFKKNQLNAFSNPELEKYLKEKNIDTVLVLGAYTHACVKASTISAKEKGFKVILIEDLIGSQDILQDLHEQSINFLKSNYAFVANSKDIIESLNNKMKGGNK